nr:hypothetical protein [Tanacetum cinerariifolium]
MYSYEFCGNDAHYIHDCPPQVYNPEPCYNKDFNSYKAFNNNVFVVPVAGARMRLFNKIPIYYDDDDDEESSTPLKDIIISEFPLYEFIKSSVDNLVPNPSEFEDLSNIRRECDVPVCDDFTTFANLLFDTDGNFSSSDDKSFSDEDVPKEIYSKPIFNEEIISIKIDPELIFLKSIPPRIDEADCDPEEEIRLIEKLFNSLMDEIDLSLTPDDLMPPGIENDDYDSEGDILILEESNDSLSLPEN